MLFTRTHHRQFFFFSIVIGKKKKEKKNLLHFNDDFVQFLPLVLMPFRVYRMFSYNI